MIVRTCNNNMLAKYLILICLNTHNVIGDIITHHKHAKPLAYELYSAKDTENETIVSLELKSKYEENFDSTFENKIFEKIRTKLEAKVNNTFDELFSCCKVPPTVTTESNRTEVVKKNALLYCVVLKGEPEPNIKWQFGNISIENSFDRYNLLPNGSLKITNLKLSDSGKYACIGENTYGSSKSNVTLNVNESPQVKTKSEMSTLTNKNVTLKCIVLAGTPPPKISWQFGNLKIDSDFSRYHLLADGSLKITYLRIADSGKYTCIAENVVATAQANVKLNVNALPKVKTGPGITETEKNNVTLHCYIREGKPMPRIKWRFGNRYIHSDFNRYYLMRNGSLKISNINPTDSGDYICIGRNSVGTAQDTLTLNVTQPPKVNTVPEITKTEKNNVTLHCDILAGIPMPTIKWRFGTLDIDRDFDRYRLMRNGSLEISNLNITDSGDYICIAKNFVGTAQDTLTLNVTQPPKVNTVPEITETEKNNVTLHCDILAGIPMPTIKWRFGTLDIDRDVDRYHLMRNGSLEISNINLSDSGDYICIAMNSVGTAQDTLTLNVTPLNIPPKIQSEGDVTELETRTATLKCTSSGVPPPTITWKFQNMVVVPNGIRYLVLSDDSLQITNLQLSDSGVYSCIAQNVLGSVEAKVNLNVNELQIPPQLLKAEENISEMENSKITMRCEFSGKPKPKVTWSVGGSSIDRDFDRYRLLPDGALMITFLYRNDTGAYTCLAQNPVGTAQTTINLKVKWNNDWCPTTSETAYNMGATAVVAGKGLCGVHDLWVIRSRHGTGLIPGKYDVHTTIGSYAMDGVEHTSTVFEIFCSPDKVVWVSNTNGIPENAILGGFTATGPSGEPLYIGRAVQGTYLTSGMIWNNVLYIPYKRLAYQHTSFEVLCRA